MFICNKCLIDHEVVVDFCWILVSIFNYSLVRVSESNATWILILNLASNNIWAHTMLSLTECYEQATQVFCCLDYLKALWQMALNWWLVFFSYLSIFQYIYLLYDARNNMSADITLKWDK